MVKTKKSSVKVVASLPKVLENKKLALLEEIAKIEKIRKDNIAFPKMSKAEQRIAIANDVIEAIEKNFVKIRSGQGYIIPSDDLIDKIYGIGGKKVELQDLLLTTSEPCDVCAKGALFICEVTKRNNFRVNSINMRDRLGNETTISKRLSEYFSKEQLDLIESAFEGTGFGAYDQKEQERHLKKEGAKVLLAIKTLSRAIRFVYKYPEDEERLVAIMKNLIKNNGEFIP